MVSGGFPGIAQGHYLTGSSSTYTGSGTMVGNGTTITVTGTNILAAGDTVGLLFIGGAYASLETGP